MGFNSYVRYPKQDKNTFVYPIYSGGARVSRCSGINVCRLSEWPILRLSAINSLGGVSPVCIDIPVESVPDMVSVLMNAVGDLYGSDK